MSGSNKYKWIRGGRIITACDDFKGEILIGDGQILALGRDLAALGIVGKSAGALGSVEEIDASGLFIFPGGIDPHTHLDLPFMGTSSSDDFESGTTAAIQGGTTSILDFAIQEPRHLLYDAFRQWQEKAKGKSVIDYGFHMAVTDLNDTTEAEIPELIKEGITSFKCFMAYKGALMVDDGQIYRLLSKVKKHGGLVTAHCENAELIETLAKQNLKNGNTSPLYHELSHTAIGESEATHRLIALSRLAKHPVYVVHLTCEESLQQVMDSSTRHKHPVFAETCPQYLLLDRSVYEKPGFEGAKWVMSPPLRTPKDQEALWAGLRDGFIQTVATDHCPFHFAGQKEMGKNDFTKIPNGAPGIENRMNLMFTYGVLQNRISLNRFVDITSTQAAKIFGMFPRKGTIAPGSDADLVLFDPTLKNTISAKTSKQNCDYSAFEGFKTVGQPISVLSGGEWALKNGDLCVKPGAGRWIHREAHYGAK
ncbi:MAG: dihydropyrimidinase [Bdellovibrionia bacterium]